ncbi:hypothetical protein EMCRGX_G027982 [Ephydatia muelleri]
MSLADELLADLDEVGNEINEENELPAESTVTEVMEGVNEDDFALYNNSSIKAIAQLADSQKLSDMMEQIKGYLENPRNNEVLGPVEADPEYQLIVESNNMIVEMDNEINVIHKFVKDKYSKRFPELESLVHSSMEYIRTVQLLRNELEVTRVNLSEILPAATIMVVSVTASTTQGQKLEQKELDSIIEACEMAEQLNQQKIQILTYVESRMSFIAPNLSDIVGPTVAARLMGVAGGLTALSKIPACNVLVLGAQKKTLAGFSSASILPHTGFIFYSDLVQSIPSDLRKKAARLVAAKCTLAARIDSFQDNSDRTTGKKLREEVEKKFEKWVEPPPVKQPKPLPRPDDPIKKRRGGRRVRRMKERYAQSQMRKQANRMTFGEIEQDAYQADLGFTTGQLGKGGVTDCNVKSKRAQVFGGKTSVRGLTSGTASSIAFTPLQGLEIVNPLATEKRVQEANQKYFSSLTTFKKGMK